MDPSRRGCLSLAARPLAWGEKSRGGLRSGIGTGCYERTCSEQSEAVSGSIVDGLFARGKGRPASLVWGWDSLSASIVRISGRTLEMDVLPARGAGWYELTPGVESDQLHACPSG